MRTPLAVLAASALLACSSGTRIIYVPTPAPAPVSASAPAPRAVPVPPRPVAVSIVRVDEHRLLMRTNQPAYLAVFEIVPNRGVTVVYPASPRQRQLALSGSHWLNVSFGSERDDDGNARDDRRRRSTHHVYAIASARPLRLSDAAFDDAGLRAMLGSRAYRATDPSVTMTALSRRFVATAVDEDWSDDIYTIDMMRQRVLRSDTVVASNGRPVRGRMEPASPRVFRVPPSTDAGNGEPKSSGGESVADSRPSGDNGGRPANDDSAERGKKAKDKQDDGKQNNGNHYGWEKRDKDEKGNKDEKSNKDEKGNNGNHYGQEKGNNGKSGANSSTASADSASRANGQGDDDRAKTNNGRESHPTSEPNIRLQGKPEQPSNRQPSDAKPESKPEVQNDTSVEAKPKQEAKGVRGVVERMRENAKAAEATPAADADSSSGSKDKKKKP